MEEIISLSSVDVVLAAIVGYSGLSPTVAPIKAGKNSSGKQKRLSLRER